MRPGTRFCNATETGLSEVIGFVLILGVLVLVFSLYLTYGVPVQGRENEILHMNEVQDQFVSYKLSLDSLQTNNKEGTTLSNAFTLGTGGEYTQGVMSFLPIMNPVGSGGVLGINSRSSGPELLTISSHSLVRTGTGVNTTADLPQQILFIPAHIYVNLSGIQGQDLAAGRVFGVNVTGRTWTAFINITPRVTYYQNYTLVPGPSGTYSLSLQDRYNYDRSDIAITVKKGAVTTLQDFTVYRNISPGVVYSLDLMDESYGLSTLIRPRDVIILATERPLNAVRANGNVTYDFSDLDPFTVSPITLGSVEYRAQNNYWIPQNYYYQMGGVVLSQNSGNATFRVPPEISLVNDSANNLVSVNINAVSFSRADADTIGGNSPVQLKTRLESVYSIPYAQGDQATGNSRQVRIGVISGDPGARAMWESFFTGAAQSAGLPPGDYSAGISGNESYIEIYGPYHDTVHNDVRLTVVNASFSTWVHGIGGIYE